MIYTNATQVPREELNDVIIESVTTDEMFIGTKVLPEKPLSQQTAHVPKITIASGNLMRATTRVRTPGSTFDRWQSTIGDYQLTCVQVGEEQLIPDEAWKAYEDYFDLEALATMEAANRQRRGHEMDVAETIQDAAVFTATAALVNYTYTLKATINFIGDMLNIIRRIKAKGNVPDTIIMAGPVYDLIRQTPLLQSWIAGSINPGAVVTSDTIQASLAKQGIRNVWVGDSYVNQSDQGNDDVINQIWSNAYIFVGSIKSGQLQTGGVGRTFYWDKMGPLFSSYSYRDEARMSNVIRVLRTTYPAITNAIAGQLVTTNFSLT